MNITYIFFKGKIVCLFRHLATFKETCIKFWDETDKRVASSLQRSLLVYISQSSILSFQQQKTQLLEFLTLAEQNRSGLTGGGFFFNIF